MLRLLTFLTLMIGLASPSVARTLHLDIDISRAERLMEIACSQTKIDESAFASSPILQAQLAHHKNFGKQFSFENYINGLKSIARCETPNPDPFRFSALVERREEMRKAISFLSQNRLALTQQATALLAPYVPSDFEYQGKVVLAGASFSCGGFQHSGIFFIDIPCLASDIEGEYEAVKKLIAHETYHAMQNRFASPDSVTVDKVKSIEQAYDFMFGRLALEGTASHIGDMREIKGEGRYSKFSRSLARRNYRHLVYNFRLFDYMMEAIDREPDKLDGRFPDIYGLAFDGAFGEHSYFVGQQMTAEIEHSFGAAAVPCLLALPLENFLLGYHAALEDNDNLAKSSRFSPATIKIAEDLMNGRKALASFETCIQPG